MLYDRLIGSDEARRMLVRTMDYQCSPFGHDDTPVGPNTVRQYQWEGWQQAWLAERKMEYVWLGLRDLTALACQPIYQRYDPVLRFPSNSITHRLDPDPDSVRPDSFASMHAFGRRLLKIPYFLYVLRELGDEGLPEKLNGSISGYWTPWSEGPGDETRAGFDPLPLDGLCTAAPLAVDPFSYTDRPSSRIAYIPRTQIQEEDGVRENLQGLPWGCKVYYAGVPFQLAPARGPDELAIVHLHRGEVVRIPVGQSATHIHILGNVIANGGPEHGGPPCEVEVVFGSGETERVPWVNLQSCEDWRYPHLGQGSHLAQAWAPQCFDPVRSGITNTRVRLRHINRTELPIGHRFVEEIALGAGDSDALPFVLAVTVEERTRAGETPGRRFMLGPEHLSGKGIGSWEGEIRQGSSSVSGTGAARLSLPNGPGKYEVALVMDSSGPISMTVHSNGQKAVQDWHLLGEWNTGSNLQRVAFQTAVEDERLELSFEPWTGDLYQPNEYGKTAWGLGWQYDEQTGAWRHEPKPEWRLYEVAFYSR